MAKFNLFDQTTWASSIPNIQQAITNKAIGAIGEKIGKLRELQTQISEIVKNEHSNIDYVIAEELRQINPQAYDIMEITYVSEDETLKKIKESIKAIESIWIDKENRSNNYMKVIGLLEPIKDYIDGSEWQEIISSKLSNLSGTKVYGNAAWKAYLDIAKRLKYER